MGPFLAAFFCFLSAGFLSYTIDPGLNQRREVFSLEHSLDRLLGSAKELVGDELFLKADSYYHGGAQEEFDEKDGDHEKRGFIQESHERKNEAPKDWIARVNDQVTMHQHYHLEGETIKEMLPFFSLATTLNPHNVEAILTTAYWIEKQFRKPEEAIALLEKAVLNNPDSWEAENALANLYFRVRQDFSQSERHYRAALKKSTNKKMESYYRMDMNYYLAESLYRLGRQAEALEFYQKALPYLTEKSSEGLKAVLLEKIKELSYNAN